MRGLTNTTAQMEGEEVNAAGTRGAMAPGTRRTGHILCQVWLLLLLRRSAQHDDAYILLSALFKPLTAVNIFCH